MASYGAPPPRSPSVVGFSGTDNVRKKDNPVARTARGLRHKLRVKVIGPS